MIFLKKLWVALTISVFAAMALTPVVVAAQTYDNSQTLGAGSSQTTGIGPSQTTGIGSSQTSGTGPSQTTGLGTSQTTGVGPSQTTGQVGGLSNPLGQVTGLCQLLKIVLNIAILVGVPIGMFFIVFAGFKLVLARGNSEALIRARNNLMWTFIGLAIFLGVWFFVNLLANTLGALGVQILGDCR
jgi:hypothetical protein